MTEPTESGSSDIPPGTPPHHTGSEPSSESSHTRIIRRAPTGSFAAVRPGPAAGHTGHVPPAQDWRARPANPFGAGAAPSGRPGEPSAKMVVAACAVTIISGWATSVVATDLISGWWRTDRLFCIAVGFLALVFATATVAGVLMLLLGRPLGRYLIIAGAVVALLTYGSIFIAGARIAWVVHIFPLLPVASVVLVLRAETTRWLEARGP